MTTSGWMGLTVCGGRWTASVRSILLDVCRGYCRRHHDWSSVEESSVLMV